MLASRLTRKRRSSMQCKTLILMTGEGNKFATPNTIFCIGLVCNPPPCTPFFNVAYRDHLFRRARAPAWSTLNLGEGGGEHIYSTIMNLRCELVSFNRLEFMFWKCSVGRHQSWTDRLTDGRTGLSHDASLSWYRLCRRACLRHPRRCRTRHRRAMLARNST